MEWPGFGGGSFEPAGLNGGHLGDDRPGRAEGRKSRSDKTMFQFGKQSGGGGGGAKKRSAVDVIRAACNRNIPICVIRPQQAGRVPMARGRMLSITDDGIDIDRVQVPGRELHFQHGDDLQAYFSIDQTLYQFRTTLTTLCEPKQLNARMVIPGMTIAVPGSIKEGDRRNVYRVSVAAQADRPSVQVWRLLSAHVGGIHEPEDEDAQEAPAMPSLAFNLHGMELSAVSMKSLLPADHCGWVVDATESGLGVRLEAVGPGRFDVFEPLLIRITMPAKAECVADDGSDMHELDFVAEVRSRRPVGDDGCRLGLVLVEEADTLLMRQKRNVLRQYLADIQREHLRKNRERSA